MAHNEECTSKQGNFIHESSEDFSVDIVKTCELPYIAPPFLLAEEIEYEYGQHAGVVIVEHRDKTEEAADGNAQAGNENAQQHLARCFRLLVEMDETEEISLENIPEPWI